MLNSSGESGHPCLIPNFGNDFCIKYDVGYRFVIHSLYNVEVRSFYFLRAFIMKWC
jgi:hypothetical protein